MYHRREEDVLAELRDDLTGMLGNNGSAADTSAAAGGNGGVREAIIVTSLRSITTKDRPRIVALFLSSGVFKEVLCVKHFRIHALLMSASVLVRGLRCVCTGSACTVESSGHGAGGER